MLETALGLVFLFALVSLFCSGITETLAGLLQQRGKYLLQGLRQMLDKPVGGATTRMLDDAALDDGDGAPMDETVMVPSAAPLAAEATGLPPAADLAGLVRDPVKVAAAAQSVNDLATTPPEPQVSPASAQLMVDQGGLTVAVFGHPIMQSLQLRKVGPRGGIKLPSYIAPRAFARALIDTLVPDAAGETSLDAVRRTVENLPDGLPAKKSLLTLLKRAKGDLAVFEQLVEGWYDDQMERVSGWYRRWAKVVLGGVGLLIAVLANVDTLQVARSLYVDQPVREAVIAQASSGNLCQGKAPGEERVKCADEELSSLASNRVPIWWPSGCGASDFSRCFRHTASGETEWSDVTLKFAGWGLTAFAVSFGAPFWFQALSRLGSLRNAGPRPQQT